MADHSPVPWRYYRGRLRKAFPAMIIEIQAPQGVTVIKWAGFDDSDLPKAVHAANARFIVRACNSHDDLLAALEQVSLRFPEDQIEYEVGRSAGDCAHCLGCFDEHEDDCISQQVEAAIAKAKGNLKEVNHGRP